MNWRINLLILVLVFSACKEEKKTSNATIKQDEKTEKINYLIEVDELLKIAKKPNIKILDFRKAAFYNKEHIKGAINIWRTDIEDTSFKYKGMMAQREQIESLFSDLGINTGDTIVIYDDNGLCDSARLWWILQNYDYIKVKLLQGGIRAWKANNGEISTNLPNVTKGKFKLAIKPSMKHYISKEEMLKALTDKTFLLDTRTIDEFSGKRRKKGALKGGRIPNSKHIDWAEAVNYHGDMKFKSIDELVKIYSKLNASKTKPIIVYCHSGVRSAHTTFVLTQLLGYKNVKNYDGSWTEWSHFNDLPIEQDSITTILK